MASPISSLPGGAGGGTSTSLEDRFTSNLTLQRDVEGTAGDDDIDLSQRDFGATVFAGGGDDEVIGTPFNDFVVGGEGNDTIVGGRGDDFIAGEGGNDTLLGGRGDDIFSFSSGDGNDFIFDFGANSPFQGNDTLQLNVDGVTSVDDLNIVPNSTGGSVTLDFGNGDSVFLRNVSESDVRNNVQFQFLGAPTGPTSTPLPIPPTPTPTPEPGPGPGPEQGPVAGAPAAPPLDLPANGSNVTQRLSADDVFTGERGEITIDNRAELTPGGATRQVREVIDATGRDSGNPIGVNLQGTATPDRLFGGAGNDLVEGNQGNDILLGRAGDDVVNGGSGNDSLNGGAGNDTLDGGIGDDRLLGGSGDDTFVFSTGSGRDTVRDFGAGSDVIQLSVDGINNFDDLQSQAAITPLAGNVVELDFGNGDVLTIVSEGADVLANPSNFSFG